jgi:ankyrin repeat protein
MYKISNIKNDNDILEYIKNINIDSVNKNGEPLIIYFVLNKKWNIVYYLVNNNCDINKKDNNNNTALHYLVMMGEYKMLNYFINKKANIYIKNKLQETPLHIACYMSNINISIIKYLIYCGSDLFSINKFGKKPLSYISNIYKENINNFIIDWKNYIIIKKNIFYYLKRFYREDELFCYHHIIKDLILSLFLDFNIKKLIISYF